MNKIIRTGVVYVFWKKVNGLLRIDVNDSEYSTVTTNAHANRTHGRAPNKKSQGETERTQDSYHGRMTYGT